jgi:N-acetylneuraminic acid mutarotase
MSRNINKDPASFLASWSASRWPVSIALLAVTLTSGHAQQPARVVAEARLPHAITSFGAASHDGWAYVYGGHIGRTHAHSASNHVGDFFRLRLSPTFSIEVLPSGPALQGLALVACAGRICRIGGMQARNAQGEPADLHSTATCASYDPRTRTWSDLPPLPEPRSSHDAVALGDTIYVAGGWTLRGKERTWSTTALRLDLGATAAVWQAIDAPFTRRGGALAVHQGRLFYMGGLEPDGGISERIDVFDVAAGSWQRGPQLRGEGFGLATLADDAGMLTSGSDGVLYRFDGTRAAGLARLLVPRFFHRLVQVEPDRILVLGGETKAGHTAVIEEIDLRADVAHVHTWQVALPTRARNRQGMLLDGENLLLFGGNRSRAQHAFAAGDFADEACMLALSTLAVNAAPDFPVARQSLTTIAVPGGPALALGGFGLGGEPGTPEQPGARSHGAVFQLDAKTKAWTPTAFGLDEPRTQCGVAVHEGRVFVFGGTDYDARRPEAGAFRFPLEVVALDPVLGAKVEPFDWRLPRPRRAFGGAQLGTHYYLVGGMQTDFEPVTACDVLDLASGTWSTIPAPASHRIAPQLVALDGALYIAGGGDTAPAIERFDPATQRWSTVLERLPIPTRHLRMFAYRERLLLVSPSLEEAPGLHVAVIRTPDSTATAPAEASSTKR